MNMFQIKKGHIYMALFVFFSMQCFAQKEYNSWVFSDSSSCIFTNGQILVNTIPNGIVGGSDAIMCDKHTGSLLFYTDGTYVYDRIEGIMPGSNYLYGCGSASQTAVIVPKPGDDSTYYLFITDCSHADFPIKPLCYSIVDMRLRNGLGDVTQKNIFICNNKSEQLTAIRACSFDGFWIISYIDSLRDYFAYRLTSSGIDINSPVISSSGFYGYTYQGKPAPWGGGELKASPNGRMIASGLSVVNTDTCVYLYNFDKNTGVLSLKNKINYSANPNDSAQDGYGVSFSLDNSKLYFTNQISQSSHYDTYLYQFDLSTNLVTELYFNFIFLNTEKLKGVFGLQLAPDGKIYVNSSKFDSVGVINKPNLPGIACDFNIDGFSIRPNINFWDLPNNIDALYYPDSTFKPDFNYNINCADSTITFTDVSNDAPNEWWWSFGDGASNSNHHSKLQNPIHKFTSPGTYTVSMWAYEGCASVDSILKTVVVPANCKTNGEALIIPTLIFGNGNATQWQIINLPQNCSLILYDELGRRIYATNNYMNNYDMEQLPSAMYFYSLVLPDGEVRNGKVEVVR